MRFESVKCDECQRIQDGTNHWMKMAVRIVDEKPVLVAMGDVNAGILISRTTESNSSVCSTEIHDLCGQGCAMKHVAKLLGWSQVIERSES